jgi:hypothetical protein
MAKKKKNKNPPTTIPAYTPVRDELMVLLINGATKSGTHKDRKKEANCKACRGKVQSDD